MRIAYNSSKNLREIVRDLAGCYLIEITML